MNEPRDLNQMQYLAATLAGPLLVVAGAGSGKTRTIVARVQRLLRDGADPERILVLTFSRKAASELRRRIGGDVRALTFHAWALLRLRARGRRLRIVDRAEARVILRRCLHDLEQAADAVTVRAELDRISRAKGRLEALDDPLARCYDGVLRDGGAIDLDDLILVALRLDERGRYDHILVDEFQDTSVAQFALLRSLAGPEDDVCVVGDEDQSIYEWRSAEPMNLQRFREAFPAARVVTLERNYRSTPTILDAANALIAKNPDRQPKRMATDRERGRAIELIEAADERDEANAVATVVVDAIGSGVSPAEIAILFRVNAQALPLERALIARDVPHAVLRGVAFAERAEVRDALALLRLVRDERDDGAFRRLATRLVKGVGPVALERLASAGAMLPAARRGVLPPRYHPAIARVVATVDGLRSEAVSLDDLVTTAWRTLGYGADPDEAEGELLATLLELAREAQTLDTLIDAVAVLDEPEPEPSRGAVSLLTLHAAKGLEFSLVCVVGVEEGLLPHRRALESERELAEERRLCYVGITRAKDRLVLSYPDARLALASLSLGVPSRFLDDIPPELVVVRRTRSAEQRPTAAPQVAAGDRVRHRRWGEGMVEGVEIIDGGRYVTIRFADRVRRMRNEYAPLERL